MNPTVTVREYARLTTAQVAPSLDQATVSASAFDWLCQLMAGFRQQGANLLQLENARCLKLDQFVGVLETPCGTLIEILPKHTEASSPEAVHDARQLLSKMLQVALDLPVRSSDKTDIQTFHHPLLEWVMKQFVFALDGLVKRGLRFDYRRIEAEQRYLRGQLDITRQLRQSPGRAQFLHIRHDVYLPDRPENRLLKNALLRVCQRTQQPDTWRLAHELAGLLAEIPASQEKEIQGNFKQWRNDRLMAHYQPIKPWTELVLGQHMPLALRGRTPGISLLFPMEKLFERYVEVQLQRQLRDTPFTLTAQASSQSLCEHQGAKIFQLRPDLLLKQGSQICLVLDTKWKLLSESDKANKYGLSQADLYQLFAYGHKYLRGEGEMMLIYPKTGHFRQIESPFDYSEQLRLWVIGFDLERNCLAWPAHWQERLMLNNSPLQTRKNI